MDGIFRGPLTNPETPLRESSVSFGHITGLLLLPHYFQESKEPLDVKVEGYLKWDIFLRLFKGMSGRRAPFSNERYLKVFCASTGFLNI